VHLRFFEMQGEYEALLPIPTLWILLLLKSDGNQRSLHYVYPIDRSWWFNEWRRTLKSPKWQRVRSSLIEITEFYQVRSHRSLKSPLACVRRSIRHLSAVAAKSHFFYFLESKSGLGSRNRATVHYFGHDVTGESIQPPACHYRPRQDQRSALSSAYPLATCTLGPHSLRISTSAGDARAPATLFARRSHLRFVGTVCVMQLHSLLRLKRNVWRAYCHRDKEKGRRCKLLLEWRMDCVDIKQVDTALHFYLI